MTTQRTMAERRDIYRKVVNAEHLKILEDLREAIGVYVTKLEDFSGNYSDDILNTEAKCLTGRDHDNIHHIVTMGSFHTVCQMLQLLDDEIEELPQI